MTVKRGVSILGYALHLQGGTSRTNITLTSIVTMGGGLFQLLSLTLFPMMPATNAPTLCNYLGFLAFTLFLESYTLFH